MPSPGLTSFRIILLAVLLSLAACDSGPDEPTLVRRQMVIFASARDGAGGMNLWMMTPEGDDLRQLTHYTDGGYYWPMDLSPDGRQVLFRRLDDFSPRSGVYLMALDGPEPQEPLISGWAGEGRFFPDGQRFIYEAGLVLEVVDLRDTSRAYLDRGGMEVLEPAVSPDGRQICFSGRPGTVTARTSEIFLMDRDGSDIRSLTPFEENNYARYCQFSADGGKVFFTLNSQLHWIDLSTGAMERVPGPHYGVRPASDTSGTRMFYRNGSGNPMPSDTSEIMAVDLDGSDLTQLTDDQFMDESPVVGVVEFRE